ncbi:MAG: hypothetical protein VZR06_12520, partial [Butyrivibrio sp.]|nr:hypothetical protein [Butyrivibrio sp.]
LLYIYVATGWGNRFRTLEMLAVRLRGDFHNSTKAGNASFRRCSEKSAFPALVKFENHPARPRTAHFRSLEPIAKFYGSLKNI